MFGATGGDAVEIDLSYLFLNWITILGTTMGSSEECRAMIAMIDEYAIEPVIDWVFSLDDGIEAMHYLDSGTHFGKAMLRVSS